MTKVLAHLLGAEQLRFDMTIRDLERAAGNPSTDIRLASELHQRALAKVKELGLDPHDTTPDELYRVLQEKVAADESIVKQSLGLAEEAKSLETLQSVVQHVIDLPIEYRAFAIKASVAKRMIRKFPPKRAMKQLNYRSLDSFLKHEEIAHVFVAAFLCESMSWRQKFLDTYSKLQPSDFESRPIAISMPQANRWKILSSKITNAQRQNIIVVKELGCVVVLPIERDISGLAITTLLLVLNAQNDIASASTFLKLQQVKPNFGGIVRTVVEQEPMTTAELVGHLVPWRVVHQYYARDKDHYSGIIFEPHVQPTDLQWYHPERVLAQLHPNLEFWQDTRYTSYVRDKTTISLNLLDTVLGYCNNLPVSQHMHVFAQRALWQELMVRYLNHSNIEQAIAHELAPQLVYVEND